MADTDGSQEAAPLPWGVLAGGVALLGILAVGVFTGGGAPEDPVDPTLELLAAEVDASSGIAGQVGAEEIPDVAVPPPPGRVETVTAQDAKEGCLSYLEDEGTGVAAPNFANWSARDADGAWEVAGNAWPEGGEDGSQLSFTCEISGAPGTWSLVSLSRSDG